MELRQLAKVPKATSKLSFITYKVVQIYQMLDMGLNVPLDDLTFEEVYYLRYLHHHVREEEIRKARIK